MMACGKVPHTHDSAFGQKKKIDTLALKPGDVQKEEIFVALPQQDKSGKPINPFSSAGRVVYKLAPASNTKFLLSMKHIFVALIQTHGLWVFVVLKAGRVGHCVFCIDNTIST